MNNLFSVWPRTTDLSNTRAASEDGVQAPHPPLFIVLPHGPVRAMGRERRQSSRVFPLHFTSFPMPLQIIMLHVFLVAVTVFLLTLICSTGNFWPLAPAAIWICLDLMTTVAGLAFCGHPEYVAIFARVGVLQFGLMWVFVGWMAWDAHVGRSPLSTIFFCAYAAYAVARALQWGLWSEHACGPAVLEAINAAAYLSAMALCIASLICLVPPARHALKFPAISASGAPYPSLARSAN